MTNVLLPLWEKVALAQRASDEGCLRTTSDVRAATPHPTECVGRPLPQGERFGGAQ
jgi:hypothetical protein